MCKVCERVNSVIEAMENLYSIEDWKIILLETEMADEDPEMNDIILHDDRNVWMNIIALVSASWAYKKKIPLFPAVGAITQHMTYIYLNQGHHLNQDGEEPKDNRES